MECPKLELNEVPGAGSALGIVEVQKSAHLQLVEQMRAIPKTETHLHLGGSWPMEYIETIADASQMLRLKDYLARFNDGMEYEACFGAFDVINEIVNSDDRVEEGVVALCRKLREEGVTHAEFRTGLKDLGSGLSGYFEAVIRGINRGVAETGVNVGLVLSLRRNSADEVAVTTVDLALSDISGLVVGMDLSGKSTVEPNQTVYTELMRARDAGLPLVVHMGEDPKETNTRQLQELHDLQPVRIGHAVHLSKAAQDWVVQHKVPIELCLSSAVKVKMINEPKEHPALRLLLDKHPVLIGTDDPLLFESWHAEENALVAETIGLSVAEVKMIHEATTENHMLKRTMVAGGG